MGLGSSIASLCVPKVIAGLKVDSTFGQREVAQANLDCLVETIKDLDGLVRTLMDEKKELEMAALHKERSAHYTSIGKEVY